MLTSLASLTQFSRFFSYLWILLNLLDDFLILYYPLKCWNSKHSILSPFPNTLPGLSSTTCGFNHYCLLMTPSSSLSSRTILGSNAVESLMGMSKITVKATWPKLHYLSKLSSFIHSTSIYWAPRGTRQSSHCCRTHFHAFSLPLL